jgi:hypothetical protein
MGVAFRRLLACAALAVALPTPQATACRASATPGAATEQPNAKHKDASAVQPQEELL